MDMKRRCYDPKNKSYRWYGAKGVGICDEWLHNLQAFKTWAQNNGYSDDLTIDRINESLDYSPGNCRWVTKNNNSRYKSTTSCINVNDIIHSGKEWSQILGLGINTINKYVRKYGLDNTVKFIEKYLNNPGLNIERGQSYYDVYMNY